MSDNTFRPFFINSNICLENENICNKEYFLNTIAGNIGNSYITYSLIKSLFGGLVDIEHIPNIYNFDFSKSNEYIEFINNRSSHVFIILQDQIRIAESYNLKLPYNEIINFINKIQKPIIVAGLGANSFNGYDKNLYKQLDPQLINFLKVLSERTNIIGVRGHYTQEVLSRLDINNTQAIGCPSFFEMGENRVVTKKIYNENLKIATNGINNQLIFKNKISNLFLQDCQYNEDKIIKIIAYNEFDFSDIKYKEYKAIKNQQYKIFSDIESWKNSVSKFDFMYGVRLHGAILSLNSGVPALVTNNDSRVMEMCELLKIPLLPKFRDSINIKEIYDSCDYSELNKAYPQLYKNYIDFLNKNDLKTYTQNNNQKTTNYIKQPTLELYTPKLKNYIDKNNLKIIFSILLRKMFSIRKRNNKFKITIFGIKL